MDGRLTDVLVEDNVGQDKTGLPIMFGFIVWADKGMKEIIANTPGVHRVFEYDTCYLVDLDPRYGREWVRSEIEARIKIGEVK